MKIWFLFRQSWLGGMVRSLIPGWLVNSFWHLPLAILAVIFYRYPSRHLKVIGVTGTDGKTTTASLIYHILLAAGKKAALISTVSAKIGKEEIPTGFHVTSPHPWKLQAFLRKIADRGYEHVVLEVTSHGLAQHRVWGINFLIGVITNVTREHLDYHESYEDYLATKAKLVRRAKIAILNRDDGSYQPLVAKFQSFKVSKLVTYGIKKKADFTPKNFPFKTSLPGEYNRYNCLAAIAVASRLEISKVKIKEAVASFRGVKGRMEEIDERQGFRVIVDFAHTPNAFENTLKTLRKSLNNTPRPRRIRQLADVGEQHPTPKLIVVFGCAGLRDREKRPVMGQIAAMHSDFIVLTAEDPRTEDVNEIIDKIAGGCLKAGAEERFKDTPGVTGGPLPEWRRNKKALFFRVPDRREAIKLAIQKLAEKGDVVVICGKGHEESMCFDKTEYPWSDQKEAHKALQQSLPERQ